MLLRSAGTKVAGGAWRSRALWELLGSRCAGPNPESDSEGLGIPVVLLKRGICGPVMLAFLHVEVTSKALGLSPIREIVLRSVWVVASYFLKLPGDSSVYSRLKTTVLNTFSPQ